MQNIKHKKLAELIYKSSIIKSFTNKLYKLAKINEIVISKIHSDLKMHCKVANIRNGTLVLSTTSPTWSHKLRFQSFDLLRSLKKDSRLIGLKSIKILINYTPMNDTKSATIQLNNNPIISKKSAKMMEEIAKTIKHQNLSTLLIRLNNKLKI